MQEAGQVVRRVRHQFAARHADEERVELVLRLVRRSGPRGGGERRQRRPEIGVVAVDAGNKVKQLAIGSARKQSAEQTVNLRPQEIFFLDVVWAAVDLAQYRTSFFRRNRLRDMMVSRRVPSQDWLTP